MHAVSESLVRRYRERILNHQMKHSADLKRTSFAGKFGVSGSGLKELALAIKLNGMVNQT